MGRNEEVYRVLGESDENGRGWATEASDDAGDGVRRWGAVEARFGKKV